MARPSASSAEAPPDVETGRDQRRAAAEGHRNKSRQHPCDESPPLGPNWPARATEAKCGPAAAIKGALGHAGRTEREHQRESDELHRKRVARVDAGEKNGTSVAGVMIRRFFFF